MAGGEWSPRCRERLRPGLWPLSVTGWFQVFLDPLQLPHLPSQAGECGRCTISATAKMVKRRVPQSYLPGCYRLGLPVLASGSNWSGSV